MMKVLCLVLALAIPAVVVSAAGLPTVYVIGDSISSLTKRRPGYAFYAADALKGVASISHNANPVRSPDPELHWNARDTGWGLEYMHAWLDGRHFDVITFNFGLWDLAYRAPTPRNPWNCDLKTGRLSTTPESYEKNLDVIADFIKPHARMVVWVDTTPIPAANGCRQPGAEVAYNAIAERVAKAHGFLILHFESRDQKQADVHYTAAGFRLLGQQYATCLRYALRAQTGASGSCPNRLTGAGGSD